MPLWLSQTTWRSLLSVLFFPFVYIGFFLPTDSSTFSLVGLHMASDMFKQNWDAGDVIDDIFVVKLLDLTQTVANKYSSSRSTAWTPRRGAAWAARAHWPGHPRLLRHSGRLRPPGRCSPPSHQWWVPSIFRFSFCWCFFSQDHVYYCMEDSFRFLIPCSFRPHSQERHGRDRRNRRGGRQRHHGGRHRGRYRLCGNDHVHWWVACLSLFVIFLIFPDRVFIFFSVFPSIINFLFFVVPIHTIEDQASWSAWRRPTAPAGGIILHFLHSISELFFIWTNLQPKSRFFIYL